MPSPIAVQVERGAKRVFATAIEWPGWSRSGRTEEAAETHRGVELRKGPRGGGRPLTKIIGHVIEAEEAYLHQLGSKRPRLAKDASVASRMAAIRDAALAALSARARDEPLSDPNKVKRAWSPRYFVRRSAWHAVDHAWEIEDRAR